MHYYQAGLQMLAALTVLLVFISLVDDLFIDLWYWSRRVYRARQARLYSPLTLDQLREKDEQPLAIMIPGWQQHETIAATIEHLFDGLDYQNYRVFVGTYPNDPQTSDEVERLRANYPRLHRIELPHPGPTCKADCLNWLVDAILDAEKNGGIEFAGVVLHESEDVVHPAELRYFNYLLPRMDMIQLPVASLERGWNEWVAATYMDEFAESHAKGMVVRESVAGVVPSAGVGTCFSHHALRTLMGTTRNKPFNIDSLTAGYDVGNRLAQLGMRTIFGVFPVGYRVRRASWFRAEADETTVMMPMGVREYFPDRLVDAYRQRAGWVLGIGLQSWQQIHWPQRWAARYLLLRDRKITVTALVNVLAYALLLNFAAIEVAAHWGVAGAVSLSPASLFREGSLWRILLIGNVVLVLIRCGHRIYFTTLLYGGLHGLLSLPRLLVGQLIDALAVVRAWRLYLASRLSGRKLAWDKTMQDFPPGGPNRLDAPRLGALLQSWQAVDDGMLGRALAEQAGTKLPLGRILVSNGWLDEETLAEAIAYQTDLPRARLTKKLVREHAGQLPHHLATRHRAVFIGSDFEDRPVLAVASPLDDRALRDLTRRFESEPRQRIVRESEISIALRLLSGSDESFTTVRGGVPGVPLLGDMLIEQNLLARDAFEAAMQNYHPDRHGRVGDYLVEQGVIPREVIERVVYQQQLMHAELARVPR